MTAAARFVGTRLRWDEAPSAIGPAGNPAEPGAMPAEAVRRLVFTVHTGVGAGIALLAVVTPLAHSPSWLPRLAAVGYAAAIVVIHVLAFGRGRVRYPVPVLAAQAGLGFLPLLQFGVSWSLLTGFFAGGVLLALKPIVAVPVWAAVSTFAGVLSAGGAPPAVSVLDGLTGGLFVAVAALAVFGLAWFARLAAERDDAHRELTRRVVAEERLRFSRDTHDLLGLSLSAITLKGELTCRLIESHPQQARAELAEILAMSRKALSDVRSVAAGYRELSLDEECCAAAAMLRAAGIEVVVERSAGELSGPVATTLATVLREGVTNVVRHSHARRCELLVRVGSGTASLMVVNDGVLPDEEPDPAQGAGLRNLAYRAGLLGGELAAGVQADGTYRLSARVPLRSAQPRWRRLTEFSTRTGKSPTVH